MNKQEEPVRGRIWTSNYDYLDLVGTDWLDFQGLTPHRTNGPAIEISDGRNEWWLNGQRHRTDGPAYEDSLGMTAWFLNDQELDQAQVETWIKENNIDLSTQAGQTAFVLRWS